MSSVDCLVEEDDGKKETFEKWQTKIHELEDRIQTLDQDKKKAAELGFQFLNENKNLQLKIDEFRKSFSEEREKLLEENFILKSRLESKSKLEEEYDADLDRLQRKLEAQRLSIREEIEQEYGKKFSSANQKISNLVKENQELRSLSDKNQLELERVTRELESKRRKARLSDDSLTQLDQTGDLTLVARDLAKTLEEKEFLNIKLDRTEDELKRVRCHNTSLEQDVELWKEKAERMTSESEEYKSSLEEGKGQLLELELELESAKMQNLNPARKGNSMFAELDDHRIKLEGELLTIKRQKIELEDVCKELRKDVDRLKRQLATALQLTNANRASLEELHSLQDELERTRGELRVANAKLAKKNITHGLSQLHLPSGSKNFRQSEDSVGGPLRDVVVQLQRENESLESQLGRQRLERATVQDDLILERKRCRGLEIELEELRKENVRLKLRHQQDQDSLKGQYKVPGGRRRREKITTITLQQKTGENMNVNMDMTETNLAEYSLAEASYTTAYEAVSPLSTAALTEEETEAEKGTIMEERKKRVVRLGTISKLHDNF